MITVMIIATWAVAFWLSVKQDREGTDTSTVMLDEKFTYSLGAFFLLLWNWGVL
jgi:hypothetical protein